KLLVARKYDSKSFAAQIGNDPTRKLPEQHVFGSKDVARIVPPSPRFTEMQIFTSEGFHNQIFLTVSGKLTVGELRKLFPSAPKFGMIMDAFTIEDVILWRGECELVAEIPRKRANLDDTVVKEIVLQ